MQTNTIPDQRVQFATTAYSVAEAVKALETALGERGIPIFAKFNHTQNAIEAGLPLQPITVLVFGAPKVGTGLMQQNPAVSLELPLRIAVWENQDHSTWLTWPNMTILSKDYGLEEHPAIAGMQNLLEALAGCAGCKI